MILGGLNEITTIEELTAENAELKAVLTRMMAAAPPAATPEPATHGGKRVMKRADFDKLTARERAAAVKVVHLVD